MAVSIIIQKMTKQEKKVKSSSPMVKCSLSCLPAFFSSRMRLSSKGRTTRRSGIIACSMGRAAAIAARGCSILRELICDLGNGWKPNEPIKIIIFPVKNSASGNNMFGK